MKKKLLAIGMALCVLLGLTACGAKSAGSPSMGVTEEWMDVPAVEAPMAPDKGYASDSFGSVSNSGMNTSIPLADQKLIFTANMSMETTEFEDAITALKTVVDQCGGYIESSSIGERGSGYAWADFTIRVPVEKFQTLLDQAGEVAHVSWCSTNQENITEVYYDTQGRLETQKIKLARLQELLSKAENMEDIITLESAISEAEWQIDNLSGTMRHYDALVSYSTVQVSLQEVYKFSNTEMAPLTFGERMGNALSGGWASFVDGMEEFVIALAYSWMWLIVLAVIAAVVIRVTQRQRRKRKEAKAAKQAEAKNSEE